MVKNPLEYKQRYCARILPTTNIINGTDIFATCQSRRQCHDSNESILSGSKRNKMPQLSSSMSSMVQHQQNNQFSKISVTTDIINSRITSTFEPVKLLIRNIETLISTVMSSAKLLLNDANITIPTTMSTSKKQRLINASNQNNNTDENNLSKIIMATLNRSNRNFRMDSFSRFCIIFTLILVFFNKQINCDQGKHCFKLIYTFQ